METEAIEKCIKTVEGDRTFDVTIQARAQLTALQSRVAELERALDTATADNADYEAANTAYTKRIAELEGALRELVPASEDAHLYMCRICDSSTEGPIGCHADCEMKKHVQTLDRARLLVPDCPISELLKVQARAHPHLFSVSITKARALLSACVQPVIDKDVCGKETANNETRLEAQAEETTP